MAPAKSSAAIVDLPDVAATRALAQRLARRTGAGDVIGLTGGLGAGKTTFARAFINEAARLHGAEPEEVPSPTFTLVQIYEFSGMTIYHVDLYRIEDPREALELGLEDAFADGVSLIEWPERLGPLLPAERLEIGLEPGPAPEARVARLTGFGGWDQRLGRLCDDA